jgi:signal peptidase I
MCRYTADFNPDNLQHTSYPSYTGDRILVSKFAYDLASPERWDVFVFKFPGDESQDSRTNFIKRLAGLPGETLRIQHGDLWVRHGDKQPFQIARKPPNKLLAMLQPVFDNDYMPRLAEYGWPTRWQPTSATPDKDNGKTAGAWSSDDYVTFHSDGAGDAENWLRYRHLAPSHAQWQMVERGSKFSGTIAPQWITDYTAYNTGRNRGNENYAIDGESLGQYWVGDLALRCTAEIESNRGALICELRKGGRQFQCRIEVATGRATLSVSGNDMKQFRPAATTAICGPGRHKIIFSNCDNELRLWVDGRVVQFDAPTTYADLGNTLPDATDLEPVGVASVGVKAQVSHLAIFRDLYYLAISSESYRHIETPDPQLSAPGNADDSMLRNRSEHPVEFTLKPDQFFALGDNSARSKDGRLWGADNYWVNRNLLIGKAVFLYWPHSWNKIPYVNIPFPYFPNFSRMGLVR